MNKTDFAPGFYLACIAAALSIGVGMAYWIGFAETVYLNLWAVFLPWVGVVVGAVMMYFKQTRNYATIVPCILTFIAFVLFIGSSYLYLSTVFYGGFSAKAIADMNPAYIVCILFYLIAIVLYNVCVYMRPMKEELA